MQVLSRQSLPPPSWKGGNKPPASCTGISAFPRPDSLGCLPLLVLTAQAGGAACSHSGAALGPARIPSQNDGPANPSTPVCTGLDGTRGLWLQGRGGRGAAGLPVMPCMYLTPCSQQAGEMSSALPKLQVTPPFSACDVSRGALAATQGSGSRLCQK